MSRVEYRAVHARAPWRKVHNHSSLEKAKYGASGAVGLLTGKLKARTAGYGPAHCVFIWEHGAKQGFVLRLSPLTQEVEERTVPIDALLRYESRGGVSAADIASWFEPLAPNATHLTGSSRQPQGKLSVARLEDIGRIRLSPNFFLRDFLYSEIAHAYGVANVPDDLDLAVSAGSRLCEELLEPLQAQFGRIAIRSAYRSCTVNELGNRNDHNCGSNERNYAAHIWDRRDGAGRMGATACIVVPALLDYAAKGGSWTAMAWWIHDHLPYCDLQFFPKLLAFNIRWREEPTRIIGSYVEPKGTLTRPGMSNHSGRHVEAYSGLLAETRGRKP